MKIIKVEETKQFKNSDLCIATEYGFDDKDIDIATAEINGRYPDAGYCVNTDVKEMIYVISGGGILHLKNKSFSFKEGDAFLIDKGEKYYWDAHCKVSMTCSPAWTPEQHKLVK